MPDAPRFESKPLRGRRAGKADVEPVPLSSLLVPTLARLGFRDEAQLVRLLRAWPAIVGDAVAGETRLTGYSRGRLAVETSSPALSHQLHLQAQVIVDGLNDAIGERVLSSVRFRLMPEIERLQKRGNRGSKPAP